MLRGIAVVVAVIGIFLTLTTLIAEREKEIGVLRALGASRCAGAGESCWSRARLIGTLAGVLGVVAGLTLSLVLTYVINKAFFGWTIQFAVPWLVGPDHAALWILLAALGRGVAAGFTSGARRHRHRHSRGVNDR